MKNIIKILIGLLITSSMNAQENELDSLFQEMTVQLPIEDIYGQYLKPASLIKLENLIETYKIDTETIGFFLYGHKPYMPAPTDVIPFATTGGDGCYFAFLTDYGYYENLEEAPIVFISPTDFDEKHPHHANKLFARNIRDFLSVMIKLQSAEVVRFKKLIEIDFDSEIRIIQEDLESNFSKDWIKRRKTTIGTLKKEFNIVEIRNLHDYYLNLDNERKKENFLDLRDGLGIKTRFDIDFINPDFSNILTLDEFLSKASKAQRLKFYREAPYIYEHFADEYQEVVLLIAKYLDQDGFNRESKILKFEAAQSFKSKNYWKARKVMLEKEKNK